MKLASIVPYAYQPYQSGGQKLIAQLYDYLGKEAEVHVIGHSGNDASLIKDYHFYPLLGSSILRYGNPFLFFRIRKLLKKEGIHTVIVEHPYYAWLTWLLKKAGYRIVLHAHNIEYARFRSIKKWWWPLLKQYEKWAFRQAAAACFISREDQELGIRSFGISPGKCHILPFGIPQQQSPADKNTARQQLLSQWQLPANTQLLLFTGHYSYQPNIDAAASIIQALVPRLQQWNKPYFILITGKGLPQPLQQAIQQLQSPVVHYAGFVEDIVPYFTGAGLLLNTVLSGGGVKTKLVEAIGYGTTVISTATGAQGVDTAVCGDKLVVVKDNDWDAFAAAIRQHAADNRPTGPLFYTTYYWGNIVQKLITILKEKD